VSGSRDLSGRSILFRRIWPRPGSRAPEPCPGANHLDVESICRVAPRTYQGRYKNFDGTHVRIALWPTADREGISRRPARSADGKSSVLRSIITRCLTDPNASDWSPVSRSPMIPRMIFSGSDARGIQASSAGQARSVRHRNDCTGCRARCDASSRPFASPLGSACASSAQARGTLRFRVLSVRLML
jgi:hypothetical protein